MLFGSAKGGTVPPGGDLDIGVYLTDASAEDRLLVADAVLRTCEELAPGVGADVVFLNDASVVMRFEALKGRMLFLEDADDYAEFYSLTCREYEDETWWRERQLEYRGYS